MTNILYLKTATEPSPAIAATHTRDQRHINRLIQCINERQAKLKEDVRLSILMLDIAVAHARLVSATTGDPDLRMRIGAYLASVEELLEDARDQAAAL